MRGWAWTLTRPIVRSAHDVPSQSSAMSGHQQPYHQHKTGQISQKRTKKSRRVRLVERWPPQQATDQQETRDGRDHDGHGDPGWSEVCGEPKKQYRKERTIFGGVAVRSHRAMQGIGGAWIVTDAAAGALSKQRNMESKRKQQQAEQGRADNTGIHAIPSLALVRQRISGFRLSQPAFRANQQLR